LPLLSYGDKSGRTSKKRLEKSQILKNPKNKALP